MSLTENKLDFHKKFKLDYDLVKKLIDYIIYDYCKNNINLINIDELIDGIKCSVHERYYGCGDIIPYFKRLYKYDNKHINKDDFFVKNNSYTLGLIIGSRYIGLCGCCWDNKYFDLFCENVGTINGSAEYTEDCNCGNGQCLHILNVAPLLKKFIDFDYNFKYGYYNDDVYSTDFHGDEYDKMLKDNEIDEYEEDSDDYIYSSDDDEDDDEEDEEDEEEIEKENNCNE